MIGVGPRSRTEKTSEGNAKIMVKVQRERGGDSSIATSYLRLPKWSLTDDPFEKLELLTSSAAPEQR